MAYVLSHTECEGYCRFHRTVLKAFGSNQSCLPALSLNQIYSTSDTIVRNITDSGNVRVFDVLGDGNCWVYSFCASLKINSD